MGGPEQQSHSGGDADRDDVAQPHIVFSLFTKFYVSLSNSSCSATIGAPLAANPSPSPSPTSTNITMTMTITTTTTTTTATTTTTTTGVL